MRKLALHWQILIAILLAVVVGTLVKSGTTEDFAPNIFGVPFISIFEYVGQMFLNALRMIIVPLITSSIIVGVAGIGSGGNLGSLGGKTLLFYATTTLAAIIPPISRHRSRAKASVMLPRSSCAWCRPISSWRLPTKGRCSV